MFFFSFCSTNRTINISTGPAERRVRRLLSADSAEKRFPHGYSCAFALAPVQPYREYALQFANTILHSFKRNNSSVDSYEKAPASSSRTGKAVRATLILIPLLGLQYIVTPFRPEPGTPWESVYQVTSAVVASCQGLCVALLFCFCNGEVSKQFLVIAVGVLTPLTSGFFRTRRHRYCPK